MQDAYKSSGVDTQAADHWVEYLNGLMNFSEVQGLSASPKNLLSGIGDYAAVYALDSDRYLALSCDGVGTKLIWGFEGWVPPEVLAQDLVAMNVNDLICVGATPLLFLDYLAISGKALFEEGGALRAFMKGLRNACIDSGVLLVGGESAQMPDLYKAGHFDVAGFAVGTLGPQDRLNIEQINEGDEIWAWESSGPHSNAYTLLRKLFGSPKDSPLVEKYFAQPTEIYVSRLKNLKRSLSQKASSQSLKAAFHITGSGWLNLLRAQPSGRTLGYDLCDWPAQDPSWVALIKERSGLSDRELFTSFNMGFGFCVVLDKHLALNSQSDLLDLGLKKLGIVDNSSRVKVRGIEIK